MSSLLTRMKKKSTVRHTDVLGKSEFFKRDNVKCLIPMMNLAFSGDIDIGFTSGVHMMAGESKTFKTGFMIQLAFAFQQKYPDGIVLFYDSENSPLEYWERFGVDTSKVLHTPIETVEQLKIDLATQLSGLDPDGNDKVLIVTDSIGGLASNKELEDAKDGKSTVDMTRAKAINSLFRIITPMLTRLNIHFSVINSYYLTMDKYPKRVYAGGKKVYLSCDDVWFVKRKNIKDVDGFDFVLVCDKSRTIIEGSEFPIQITSEKGIDKHSGLYDLAKECGLIVVKGAWLQLVDFETGELSGNTQKKNVDWGDFYNKLLMHEPFKQFVRDKYQFKSQVETDG